MSGTVGKVRLSLTGLTIGSIYSIESRGKKRTLLTAISDPSRLLANMAPRRRWHRRPHPWSPRLLNCPHPHGQEQADL
jgi:hypothetical protein